MTITTPHTDLYVPAAGRAGPNFGLLGGLLAAFAVWAGAVWTLPADLIAPAIALLMFVFAGIFATAAWLQGGAERGPVTYRDVAGALLLIGLWIAAVIDRDEIIRAMF